MNYETARKNLIEQHIRPWNVYRTDVIKSLYNVPRENFVPNKYKKYALSDLQVPLNGNDSMLSPMVEARVLQSALTKNCGEILEIGCGSGYMAALLAQVYKSVITVEINQHLFSSLLSSIICFDSGLRRETRQPVESEVLTKQGPTSRFRV